VEPISRAWNTQRAAVEELMNQVKDLDEDVTFNVIEIEKIKETLAKVESELEAQIRNQGKAQEEIKAEVARLHEEMAGLRSQLGVFTKKTWLRSAWSRMVAWGVKKENQDFLLDAAKTATKLIGSSNAG
jgi:archaellum component FlaC